MATKTISLDLEADERLRRARLTPDESFSRVVKRAVWPGQGKTCGAVLEDLAALPVADEGVIERLDAAQREDEPPDDAGAWHAICGVRGAWSGPTTWQRCFVGHKTV